MDIKSFLFPRELRVSSSQIGRVLIVGSCLAESFAKYFRMLQPSVEFDYVLFNNVSEIPELESANYHFQYLQIPLRTLVTDDIVRFHELCEAGNFERLAHESMNRLDAMLDAGLRYNRRYGLLTIVSNIISPQQNAARSLGLGGGDFSLSDLVDDLNRHIRRRVAEERNVFVADLDRLASSFGKSRFLDDWWHAFYHAAAMAHNWTEGPEPPWFLNGPLPEPGNLIETRERDFYALAWEQIEAIFRTVRQIDPVKLVIFDLDNTLWRGQIADHYGDDGDWPSADGWPEGLVEVIHHLRARGILVALCSRNDEELVRQRWSRAMRRGRISIEDFVTVRINFRPKADNVGEIMEALGLTPGGVVFVDDNPVERAAVCARFPAIRAIGDNQFLTRRILLWAPETQMAWLSGESRKREDMVRQQIQREVVRGTMNREEFLASLECRLQLRRVTGPADESFGRCLELLNKTNQFNTTGRRWTYAEIVQFLQQGGFMISAAARDRFTDYGLIGVALCRNGIFEQIVLSCRVLGLEIETGIVAHLMAEFGIHSLASCVTETNKVSREFLKKLGMPESTAAHIEIRWLEMRPAAPAHIAVDAVLHEAAA